MLEAFKPPARNTGPETSSRIRRLTCQSCTLPVPHPGERSAAILLHAGGARKRREGQPLETQGGGNSDGVHEEIEGVESAAEERNAKILTALDDSADAEDDDGATERTAEYGNRCQTESK